MPFQFLKLLSVGGLATLLILGCTDNPENEMVAIGEYCTRDTRPERRSTLGSQIQEPLQFGDELSRFPLRETDLSAPLVGPAAEAYVRFRNASGFYIGFQEGWHLIGTAFHVIDREKCEQGGRFRIPALGFQGRFELCVFTSELLDFTIVGFQAHPMDLMGRSGSVGSRFSFAPPRQGEALFIIGRPTFRGGGRVFELIQDDDCRVLSRTNDLPVLRTEAGENQLFAMGCDIAHGDSGAAVRSAETGRVVGIVSHAVREVNPDFQCSSGLRRKASERYSSVWNSGLAAPASEIRHHIEQHLRVGERDSLLRRILHGLIVDSENP